MRLPEATLPTLAIAALFAWAQASGAPVAEFDAAENARLGWQIVDDGVMGGLSRGELDLDSAPGILRFTGKLSLENNGGFSSVRTQDVDYDLSVADGLVLRVKGDGRNYQVRLGTDARYRGMEISFMAEFPTTSGEWREVKVPFDQLVGTFRGQTLRDAVFDPAKIRRLGLLLADNRPGDFALEVDWIRPSPAPAGSIVELAVADGRFTTLATALAAADLVDALEGEGPFTVFAPTDEAFAQLPEGALEELLEPGSRDLLKAVLTYHVGAGQVGLAAALGAGSLTTLEGGVLPIRFADGRVRVGTAAMVDADIVASNGVIHVIDAVLLPTAPAQPTDILGIARADGNFNTLLTAIEAADLAEVLQGDGPFTVLAPTDNAFASLPKGTVESLLKPENLDQLRAVLTFHLIPGAISAGEALAAGTAETVNGQTLSFAINDGLFQVEGATIRATDVKCDNGVIHVIDAVLLPGDPQTQGEPATATCPSVRIEQAIDRGVPTFNSGNHASCAAIYLECLQALAADEQVDKKIRDAIETLLGHLDARASATARAWQYRLILDQTYQILSRS